MKVWAFDSETYLISPGLRHPPVVCWSLCEVIGETHGEAQLLDANAGLEFLTERLQAGDAFVGINTAFDVMVSVLSSDDPEAMMSLWVNAYEDDRVTDCLVRQALFDISIDDFRHKYSMASIAVQLDTKTRPDKTSKWRTTYGTLDGIPISEWPAEAVGYSKDDAVVTAQCYLAQERLGLIGSPFFPGMDPFADQFRQGRGALALADISECGVRSCGEDVGRLTRLIEARYARLLPKMIRAGFVTIEYKRGHPAILKADPALPRTKAGKPSLSRKALLASASDAVQGLIAWPESAPEAVMSGIATQEYKRKQGRVRDYFETIHLKRMRRFALGLTPKPELLRKAPKKGDPPNKVHAVRTDADACEQSGSRLLKAYAEFSSLGKMLSTDLPLAQDASEMPWNVHYRILQQTGRTSSGADDEGDADGNGQNKPRKPGIRELYAPRKGNVFFDCDYKALELWTFAQCAQWFVGYSKLGEDLLAGNDPHLRRGVEWYSAVMARQGKPVLTYEQAVKEVEGGTPLGKLLKRYRTGGKGVNFGRKGMMSAKKFVLYCWNNYRLKLGDTPAEALETAQLLIDLHDEFTPEFPEYSAAVLSSPKRMVWNAVLGKRVEVYDFIHPYSLRLVAGLYFTDVHNYPFQGLGADVAKRALWLAMKARWGLSELGRTDPMYRCLLVEFTHDSITGETKMANGRAAAKRLADVMYQASAEVCPDYASQTESALAYRMGKGMEPLYEDKAKTLLRPWDPWASATKALGDRPATRSELRKLESDHSPLILLDVVAARGKVAP